MIETLEIENMSHLTSSFALRSESEKVNYVDRDVDGIHPTQQNKQRIKLILLFFIPGVTDEDGIYPPSVQRPESLPRLASVRVPRGVPVARLRLLVKHIEEQLHNIYGKSKRANIVLMCDEFSENWEYSFDLPTFGVVYV